MKPAAAKANAETSNEVCATAKAIAETCNEVFATAKAIAEICNEVFATARAIVKTCTKYRHRSKAESASGTVAFYPPKATPCLAPAPAETPTRGEG